MKKRRQKTFSGIKWHEVSENADLIRIAKGL